MSWDVAVDGQLKFADAIAAEGLVAAPLTGAPELEGAPPPFAGAVTGRVSEALAAWAGPTFEATARGPAIVLRGLWTRDDFHAHGARLATLVATAARRGARGAVLVVGVGTDLGFRLAADKERARIMELKGSELERLSRAPWVVDAVERAAKPPTPPPAAAPDTPIERALTLLSALDDAALFACAHDLPPGVSVRLKGKPLDQAWVLPTVAYPSGAELRAALFPKKKPRTPPDWIAPFALPALAVHDPALAEPLAVEVLARTAKDPTLAMRTNGLRAAAAHALGHCATATAVDALFAALEEVPWAAHALGRNAHPSVAPRALAGLDEATLAPLFVRTNERSGYLFFRATSLIRILGWQRYTPALDTLLGLFARLRDREPGRLVGHALIDLGDPRGLQAVALLVDDSDQQATKVGVRAFLRLDPASAWERAQRFLDLADEPRNQIVRAFFEAFAQPPEGDAIPIDPRWIELARQAASSSSSWDAWTRNLATHLLERASSPA